MSKLAVDAGDAAKGAVTVSSLEYFLHFIKVDLGIQSLQQVQMYAIAATTLQWRFHEPRLELFAIWTGLIDGPSYSIFTSILTLSLLRDVIRPPTVRLLLLLLILLVFNCCFCLLLLSGVPVHWLQAAVCDVG